MTEIKTNRLLLRNVLESDAEEMTRLISDWRVIRWLTSPPWPYRVEDAHDFIATLATPRTMAITCDGVFMGVVDISDRGKDEDAELGYWLATEFHGAGIMTEAASALVADHFASGHSGLYSGYINGNTASCNVLRKLGFVETGQVMRASRPLARDVEICEMRLSAETWRSRHAP